MLIFRTKAPAMGICRGCHYITGPAINRATAINSCSLETKSFKDSVSCHQLCTPGPAHCSVFTLFVTQKSSLLAQPRNYRGNQGLLLKSSS